MFFEIRPPTEENAISVIAVVSGTVAVELKQIPNQPITFAVKISSSYEINICLIILHEKDGSNPSISI